MIPAASQARCADTATQPAHAWMASSNDTYHAFMNTYHTKFCTIYGNRRHTSQPDRPLMKDIDGRAVPINISVATIFTRTRVAQPAASRLLLPAAPPRSCGTPSHAPPRPPRSGAGSGGPGPGRGSTPAERAAAATPHTCSTGTPLSKRPQPYGCGWRSWDRTNVESKGNLSQFF
jgi:hypothetical protein